MVLLIRAVCSCLTYIKDYRIIQNSQSRMQQERNVLFNNFQTETNQMEAEQRFNEEESYWRTNLLLDSEVERVKQRGQKFNKRTSFEENIINEHLSEMLTVASLTGLQIISNQLPQNDKLYAQSSQSKQIEVINSNSYLTEYQKFQLKESIFLSQQNFSILMRLSSVFIQNKDELVYLLCKILHFCTIDLDIKEKYNSKKETLIQLIDKNKTKLINRIMDQEIIKVVNPLFFSNVNEIPLMSIVAAWFYHTLCIKQGLYGDDLKFCEDVQESCFEQQSNFQI